MDYLIIACALCAIGYIVWALCLMPIRKADTCRLYAMLFLCMTLICARIAKLLDLDVEPMLWNIHDLLLASLILVSARSWWPRKN